jgi:hypothetical protein
LSARASLKLYGSFELPNRLRCSLVSETGNFLEVYGGQADAFSEGTSIIPNAGREDDEEMQSDLVGEETEGVTQLAFYQRRVRGKLVCFRFIKYVGVTVRNMVKARHAVTPY